MVSSARRPRVLLVEDEPGQREMLTYNLEAEGYHVLCADNGEEALLLVEEEAPDIVLLDWMLPRISGIEVCRQIKRRPETREIPVIMLSARSEESDRVRGLDTGADDYLPKPYLLRELMARIRVRLRAANIAAAGEAVECGAIRLDAARHRVTVSGQEVHLGPIEFRLLATLMERPGRVWSREHLLNRVWERELDVDTRTVDVHVGRLRKALSAAGAAGQNAIRTVRGIGYALDE